MFPGVRPGAETQYQRNPKKSFTTVPGIRAVLWWRPGGGAVLPIWFPLIPGRVSRPWQVLGTGGSPLGGPRQGPFKPSPADRLQGSVGPPWLPSYLPSPGGRILGKLETKGGRCRSPGLPFISRLSQSTKGSDTFRGSRAAEETQKEEASCVPQQTSLQEFPAPLLFPHPLSWELAQSHMLLSAYKFLGFGESGKGVTIPSGEALRTLSSHKTGVEESGSVSIRPPSIWLLTDPFPGLQSWGLCAGHWSLL